MNVDNDGTISKDDFKTFIGSSKVAELDDRDFEVLFRSIDINCDDMVDFPEFCASFAVIRGDYDKAIQRSSVLRALPSYVYSPGSSLRTSAKGFVSELPAVDEDVL